MDQPKPKKSLKKKIIIAVAVYAMAMVVLIVYAVMTSVSVPATEDCESCELNNLRSSGEPKTTVVSIPSTAPSVGPANAKVTIIEFSDFQCPICQSAHSSIRALTDLYPNEVRLVYRHFPLESVHPLANELSHASMCAHEQGKFWEIHDRFFLGQSKISTDKINNHAQAVGVDLDEFKKCQKSGKWNAAIQKDLSDGISAGVRGTPTWVVNGQFIQGAFTLDQWSQMVDSLL